MTRIHLAHAVILLGLLFLGAAWAGRPKGQLMLPANSAGVNAAGAAGLSQAWRIYRFNPTRFM